MSPIQFPQVGDPVASVLVVGYAAAPSLLGCLTHLAEATEQTSFEVIVVANALAEEPASRLSTDVEGATVVTSRVNRGFAGACNLGASRARGRYLMFLNADTHPLPGWLDRLVETAEQTGAGAVGSRMLNADGTLQEAGSVIWDNGATWSVGRGLPGDGPEYAERRRVDYCSASSLLVRRETFEAIGGMDEQYFPAYYEDVDLCLWIKSRGEAIVYEPASVVRHSESESSTLRFKVFLLLRHRDRFVKRWRDELATKVLAAPLDRGAVERAVILAAQEEPGDRKGDPPPKAVLHLDEIPGDRLPRDVVRISGWAFFGGSLPRRVEIAVDGKASGKALLGLERADLAGRWPSSVALISGFEHLIDLSSLRPDAKEVTITARAVPQRSEQVISLEHRFRVLPPESFEPFKDQAPRPRARTAGPLKLAVFAHGLGYGGAELWLAEWLRRAGAGSRFDCTVIAPEDGPLRKDLETQHIATHISPDEWRSAASYERHVTDLAGFLSASGHTAVLANTALSLAGADAGLRAGCPVAWALHESWRPRELWPVFFGPGFVAPGVRQRLEEVAGQVQALIFPAEATRRLYLDLTASPRALVIPYGIDVASIDQYMAETPRVAARATLGIRAKDRVLLVVGIAQPRKCQTLVAETFAGVAPRRPSARLFMVGVRDDSYGRAVAKVARGSGLGLRLDAVPLTPEVNLYYRAADVLFSAAAVEGLPRSMLEAMSFGLPVVSSAAFGVPELIRDGEEGFLYEPSDVSELAGALERALEEDGSRLVEMGARGRARVLSSFDSAGYAEDIRLLLEGLSEDPEALPADVLSAAGRSPERRLRDRSVCPADADLEEPQDEGEVDLVYQSRELQVKDEYIRALEQGLDDDLERAREEVGRLQAELSRVTAELEAVKSRRLYRATDKAAASLAKRPVLYKLARAAARGLSR